MSGIHVLKEVKGILRLIYSKEKAHQVFRHLKNLMDLYGKSPLIQEKRKKYHDNVVLNEKDSILIVYPDGVYQEGEKPLCTLRRFLKEHVGDVITGVHILPFFPASSDGGFAVVDYKKVDPRFGTWHHIREIALEYRLAVDLVLNHVSSHSEWFQGFLNGDRRYRDYFIWSDSEINMPEVFRPREAPLFTKFQTVMGEKYVWTTFSADQIDLNYRNPEVLLRIVDVLLFYLSQGAEVIRLDAVGYVWKEPHTSCVNLSKTHQIVKLLRRILQHVAPYALILAEANFPYKEDIAYLGEGDEAHMVYQFALPPLVLDAFARKDTSHIQKITEKTRQDLLFFDFLSSHDGIGLQGAKGILTKRQIRALVWMTVRHGGLVSYMKRGQKKEPYELNITYFDAVNGPDRRQDPLAVRRFIASQAIIMVLKGVPGIYIHSLLGSRNDYRGVQETGIKRMINRQKLPLSSISRTLMESDSQRREVFEGLMRLLAIRKGIRAFHPAGTTQVLHHGRKILGVAREFADERVLAIINVSDETVALGQYKGSWDLITGSPFDGDVAPYGVYFLCAPQEARVTRVSP